jgi:hypothetical protein
MCYLIFGHHGAAHVARKTLTWHVTTQGSKTRTFTVVGVSLDRPDGKSAWLAAIKSDGLDWTQLSDLKFWNNQAAALYSVTSIPQNYLIDPQGKIIAKNLRGEDLDTKLEQLFGKYN